MKHSEDRFTGTGERAIYLQCWEPETTPRAVLLLAHGAGEHSSRYQPLAQFFCGYNYAVAALDHQGHGYSDGTPGYVNTFKDYVSDLAIFHRQIQARFPGVPMFLLFEWMEQEGHKLDTKTDGVEVFRTFAEELGDE